MPVVRGLVMYYTMQCNASCAHCGVWSSPDRQERMNVPQAKRYLDQMAGLGQGRIVIFVGGEPMIHADDIIELVAYARSLGVDPQVSTNAYWASTEDRARDVLRRLAEAGLTYLALSADSYHSEFIDPRNVGRAFKVAREFGMIRKLQVIKQQSKPETDELYAATGIDPAEVVDQSVFKMHRHDPAWDFRDRIIVARHSVAPFGRAAFLKGHAIFQALDALEDLPCFMALKYPLVYPNGDIFTCCCTAGFFKEYYVGNLEQESMEVLDARMAEDVVFSAISKVGPVALAKAVREGGGEFGESFVNPCHACRQLLTRTDRSVLEEKSRNLLFLRDLFIPRDVNVYDELVV